jgi:hypothetical protein
MKPGLHLLDLMTKPGTMVAMLTHDAETDWPDRQGVAMAEATLERGGSVITQFETMAGALSAHGRVLR